MIRSLVEKKMKACEFFYEMENGRNNKEIRKSSSFPVIFVSIALNVRVFVGVKVETRREREASLKGAMHPRAYSTVAHGLCCVLPQASASVPPFETILFWLMIGSHPLYTLLSAVPAFHTLFVVVVEPHCWKGD
ncbi:uncharacterized protein MONOS_15382 [Monocercomonoides exilis]|uniref:uncharacterized protein n=1 Tax=Monocercomonoides exilis TaxID=2049356 RepID=UPI0035594486|nr:hypothetical protein MONOS_15382 [Monocercomonoides exilis]|eukprot:MONOS_15382.1-p1 / transcript=MONOS_15382.1 / gene=MONOS_15382 / organism=Monocercomonoides_exilis_PA203 / gene_product=unspecified product / transcript_product=unspecified product / location=Mono_scaffold01213:11298-11699(+) / protein_length=134 / sequence_SO=supercontig / SO=protein_coding / is_pseudo=false